MSKYKHRLLEIEAFQWTGDQTEDPKWVRMAIMNGHVQVLREDILGAHLLITYKDNDYTATAVSGDYLVFEKDMIRVWDKDQFEKTYEKIDSTFNNGDQISLVKISDDKFDGKHPNSINEGFVITGELIRSLKVGEGLQMYCDPNKDDYDWFGTSVVMEIINENTFRTLNSTYHIEKIPEAEKEIFNTK